MVSSIRNLGKTCLDGVKGSYVQDVETVKIAIASGGSAIIPYFVNGSDTRIISRHMKAVFNIMTSNQNIMRRDAQIYEYPGWSRT